MKYEEMLSYERLAWEQGFRVIAGIDEAGRGPWPVRLWPPPVF